MKTKTIIIYGFLFWMSVNSVFAQNNPNRIKTNILGLFTLFYENQFSEKMSLQVGLQYNPKNLPAENTFVKSIAPELRYYFKSFNEKGGGIFGAAYTKFSETNNTNDSGHIAGINTIAAGLNFGFLHIFKNNITAELFAGGGYNIFKKIDTVFPSEFPEKNYKFDIRIGIGLGYSF